MRRISTALFICFASLLGLMSGSAAAAEIPGAYIVTLSSGEPGAAAADARRRHGADVEHVYRYAVRGYAARMSPRAAAAVARQDGVASVVADRTVSASAQTLPTGINRIDGELSSTRAGDGTGAVNVDVAVIDSGIAAHTDLAIAGGRNCSTGNSYNDGNGHGTHVAGTIGAKDDANGVVGVAPGARA